MEITFANKGAYHYLIDKQGIVSKGKCRRKKQVVIRLEQNYDLLPPSKIFWDSLILLLNRLFETHSIGWEEVLVENTGKNLKVLLENHRQRA
jgi:hypothetical protein